MRLPKRYGQSRMEYCPFCGKRATTANDANIPVCRDHKNAALGEMKCACGKTLELKNGKFGPFYACIDCGPRSLSKIFELNGVKDVSGKEASPSLSAGREKSDPGLPAQKSKTLFDTAPVRKNPREIVVRADDPFYCG